MYIVKRSLISTVVLALAFSMSAWGTYITNGDFETGDLDSWATDGPGDSPADIYVGIDSGTGSNVAIMETGYDPDSGEYMTSLYQDFVIPLEPLLLTFDFSFRTFGIPEGDPGWTTDPDPYFIDGLIVSLDIHGGDFIDLLIVDDTQMRLDPLSSLSSPGAGGFYTLSTDVSSYAGEEATIFFDLLDEDDNHTSTAMIDNVSSNPIPEPGTILLVLTGLGGIGVLRRARSRRRQSQ